MGAKVVFAGPAAGRDEWMAALRRAAAELGSEVALFAAPDDVAPREVDYLLYAPDGPIETLAPYAGVKAILSLWAGVETILERPDLPDVPIARMVEPGLTDGMRDYVVGHVLRAHLDVDRLRAAQAERRWDPSLAPPLARNRRVGVLGLGALGVDCAKALVGLGFQVAGWSRRPKSVSGVESFAGPDGLKPFLSRTEILVCLLPLTPATRGLLGADALAALPEGAHLVNAARGPILDETALLAALETRLASATLDVFDVEPLPADHPYWSCAKILVTPHVASVTRPETAARRVMAQIAAHEAGAPLADLVDVASGY